MFDYLKIGKSDQQFLDKIFMAVSEKMAIVERPLRKICFLTEILYHQSKHFNQYKMCRFIQAA